MIRPRVSPLRNLMESQVYEQALLQTAALGEEALRVVNLSEVMAYALNRLPPLYATTQAGLVVQGERAQSLAPQVKAQVAEALAVVREHPDYTEEQGALAAPVQGAEFDLNAILNAMLEDERRAGGEAH